MTIDQLLRSLKAVNYLCIIAVKYCLIIFARNDVCLYIAFYIVCLTDFANLCYGEKTVCAKKNFESVQLLFLQTLRAFNSFASFQGILRQNTENTICFNITIYTEYVHFFRIGKKANRRLVAKGIQSKGMHS